MLVWIYICQNATLLEIICRGSIALWYSENNNKWSVLFQCSSACTYEYNASINYIQSNPQHNQPIKYVVHVFDYRLSVHVRTQCLI